MTNITTPFAGTETTAQVQTKLSAIANYWSGTSTALSGAGSWGAVRAILNNFANAANQINNLELASSFITKLNWLNDSDNMITPLFANGEQGAWYDPAELDTMFTTSTGTTPVTAAGDPVGLILDKSQNGVGTNGARRVNLLNWTEAFNDAVWAKSNVNVVVDSTNNPNGAATADTARLNSGTAVTTSALGLFLAASTYISQPTASALTAASYTYSVYVKAASGLSHVQIRAGVGANLNPASAALLVRLSDGAIIDGTGAVSDAGNGWWRVSVTFTATAVVHHFGIWFWNSSSIASAAGTEGIYVWGADVRLASEASTAPTPYQPITSSWYATMPGNHAFQATPSARPILARQPLTGVRNLVTRSNVFGSTGWIRDAFGTASAPSVSATNILSPDGQNNASSIIFNVGAGTTSSDASRLIQSPVLTLNAVAHTESVWLKVPSGSAIVELGISGSAGSVKDVTVTDQWTRFSTTGTPSFNFAFSIVVRGDTTPGSTTLYVYGAQLEVGSTATAYQEVVSQYDVTESGVQSIWALDFDGTDDRLATSSLVPGTDKTQVFIGVRKTTDALQASILRLGASTSNEFRVQAPNANLATNFTFLTRGVGGGAAVAVGIKAAPTTDVITCIGDIANDVSIIRIDGVQAGSSSTDQGSGNYVGQLYIGAEAGATLPFRGRVFSLITRFGSNMSAPQIQQTETYVNARTGAY